MKINPTWTISAWNPCVMIYSWLFLYNKAWVIMDPAAGILVGWLIAVKVKGNTLRGVTAKISTLFNCLILVKWSGSFCIMLHFAIETVLTHWNMRLK